MCDTNDVKKLIDDYCNSEVCKEETTRFIENTLNGYVMGATAVCEEVIQMLKKNNEQEEMKELSDNDKWITIFCLSVFIVEGMIVQLILFWDRLSVTAIIVFGLFVCYFNKKIKKKRKEVRNE